MKHNPKVCVYDAVTACNYIIEFTKNISLEEYEVDSKTRFAVERQFEILGEALNRVKKIDIDLLSSVSDWNDIIAFRNVVSHAYDSLNNGIVFDIAKNDAPVLYDELKAVLDKL